MFSPKLILNNNVKALVCDMAGTTVNEGGIIYKILYRTIKNFNLDIVNEREIDKWHGANKYEVLDYYLKRTYLNEKYFKELQPKLHKQLNNNLIESYSKPGNLSLIHKDLPKLFNNFRENDIKIFLNTGYPKEVQESIIKSLNMNEFIDDYVSSEEVFFGRPKPDMINKLANRNNILNNQIIKIGDTPNDILEGINAKCYKTIGVLSGADNKNILLDAGADMVINSVMDIKLK